MMWMYIVRKVIFSDIPEEISGTVVSYNAEIKPLHHRSFFQFWINNGFYPT
jgi:hypothetical protein